jgi:hypothetical protein
MRWAGHVTRVGEERKRYKTLVGKPEGNNHSEDRREDGKDEIRMNLGETDCGCGCGMDSIGSG